MHLLPGTSSGECSLSQPNVLYYIFEPSGNATPHASFESNTLRVAAPLLQVKDWARAEVIGLYYNFETEGTVLKVAIEKDLECTDSTSEDQDPDAFPRPKGNNC